MERKRRVTHESECRECEGGWVDNHVSLSLSIRSDKALSCSRRHRAVYVWARYRPPSWQVHNDSHLNFQLKDRIMIQGVKCRHFQNSSGKIFSITIFLIFLFLLVFFFNSCSLPVSLLQIRSSISNAHTWPDARSTLWGVEREWGI